jgi:hypothetical protein
MFRILFFIGIFYSGCLSYTSIQDTFQCKKIKVDTATIITKLDILSTATVTQRAKLSIDGTYHIKSFAEFLAFKSLIGPTTKADYSIDAPIIPTANCTSSVNLNLCRHLSSGIIMPSAYNFHILKQTDDPMFQIFDTTSNVTYGPGAVLHVRPEWWGAVQSLDTATLHSPYSIGAYIQAAANSGAGKILISPGTYVMDTRHYLYNDGTYSQVTRCGTSIPSNTTIEGYGATIYSTTQNYYNYSFFSSFRTHDVHIRGLKLIGDRRTNPTTPLPDQDYGFGVDFRDVTNCSVSDVQSDQMWGDGFYLGTTDVASTGSNGVTYCNISSDSCRRQGLSITAGENIRVDGFLFTNIIGALGGPCAGIDIEPNTSDWVNDVIISNGHVEDANSPLNCYKTINMTVNNLTAVNCEIVFPRLIDRVQDCRFNNIIGIGGTGKSRVTGYGVLMQSSNQIKNIFVNNFTLKDAKYYAFFIEGDTPSVDIKNVRFSNGSIFFKDDTINTSYINCSKHDVIFDNVTFQIPSGFGATDTINLDNSGTTILNSTALYKNCRFNNLGSVPFIANVSSVNTQSIDTAVIQSGTIINAYIAAGTVYLQKAFIDSLHLGYSINDATLWVGDQVGMAESGTGARSASTILLRNAFYSSGAWRRRILDQEASSLILDGDGGISYKVNTDSDSTAGSAITFSSPVWSVGNLGNEYSLSHKIGTGGDTIVMNSTGIKIYGSSGITIGATGTKIINWHYRDSTFVLMTSATDSICLRRVLP